MICNLAKYNAYLSLDFDINSLKVNFSEDVF